MSINDANEGLYGLHIPAPCSFRNTLCAGFHHSHAIPVAMEPAIRFQLRQRCSSLGLALALPHRSAGGTCACDAKKRSHSSSDHMSGTNGSARRQIIYRLAGDAVRDAQQRPTGLLQCLTVPSPLIALGLVALADQCERVIA